MFGLDLSNHQKWIDLSAKDFDFAIIKGTEGYGFVDPSFDAHLATLKKLNKLIGVYHFARPDNHRTRVSMEACAEDFASFLKSSNLIGKVLPVLDWECDPVSRIDLLEYWLNRFYDITDIIPILYINRSFYKQYKNNNILNEAPLWIAKWNNNPEMYEWPNNEYLASNMPECSWKIWQFTSRGKWPGFSGSVDYNYTYLSKEQWMELCNPTIKENINLDMLWAIDKGLFKGYSDGSYRPDEPLTRSQLATVLLRYDNLLREEGKK